MTSVICPKCGKKILIPWLFCPEQLTHAIANHCQENTNVPSAQG